MSAKKRDCCEMELQTIHEYVVHDDGDGEDGESPLPWRTDEATAASNLLSQCDTKQGRYEDAVQVEVADCGWANALTRHVAPTSGYDSDDVDASSSPDDEDTISCLPTKKVHLRQQHSIAITTTAALSSAASASSRSTSTRSRRHTLANVRQIQDLR
jgi:hypothetical protein